MRYRFECEQCGEITTEVASIKDGPPTAPCCCGSATLRIWDLPQVISRIDSDFIPHDKRVVQSAFGRNDEVKIEKAYQRDIEQKRHLARQPGKKGIRMTHSIPTELYWGKIKETGDKKYWDDPKNRNRHGSCKVS